MINRRVLHEIFIRWSDEKKWILHKQIEMRYLSMWMSLKFPFLTFQYSLLFHFTSPLFYLYKYFFLFFFFFKFCLCHSNDCNDIWSYVSDTMECGNDVITTRRMHDKSQGVRSKRKQELKGKRKLQPRQDHMGWIHVLKTTFATLCTYQRQVTKTHSIRNDYPG